MIVSEFYDGQGLGNQLWCYVVTRVIASDHGYEYGFMSPEKFKGNNFLSIDMGNEVIGGTGPEGGPPTQLPLTISNYYSERRLIHPSLGKDIRTFDESLISVKDNCKIDGVMQDETYIYHKRTEIGDWLKYQKTEDYNSFSEQDVCVINFRGGEYKFIRDVFLRRSYWNNAVDRMRLINPEMKFRVITDDTVLAKKFFPKFQVDHYGISGDYQAINAAPYLILSNSSFAFFPAWLNENLKFCIAPKYWSSHNISDGYWSCGYNIVRDWSYLDRAGMLWTYNECVTELQTFIAINKTMYEQKKIEEAFLVVSSFNNDLSWVPRYSSNYLVFEQGNGAGLPSNLDPEKVKYVSNNGSNLRDYFTFIIDNYENLPSVIFLVKGNIFPRHVGQDYFDSLVSTTEYTPLIDERVHVTLFPLSYFNSKDEYCELNSDWYVGLGGPWKYFNSLNSLRTYFLKEPKTTRYVNFAPGAQFIVPREIIRRLPKEFYEKLRVAVSHQDHGGQGYVTECHLIERALHGFWTDNFEISESASDQSSNLPIASLIKPEHSILKRLIFVSFDLVAKAISFSKSLFIKFANGAKNRLQYYRNFYVK